MQCWMNGSYMAAEDLRISPFDHGFLYGLGFFETFRTYEGQIFEWDAHMKRLQQALSQYRIHLTYPESVLFEVVQQLNQQAGGQDGYFRLNVSAGEHNIGLQPTEYMQPNVIIFRKELLDTPRGTEKTAQWLTTPRNSPEQSARQITSLWQQCAWPFRAAVFGTARRFLFNGSRLRCRRCNLKCFLGKK